VEGGWEFCGLIVGLGLGRGLFFGGRGEQVDLEELSTALEGDREGKRVR
jgi:hypothetical protein